MGEAVSRLSAGGSQTPYQQRVSLIRDLLRLVKRKKYEDAPRKLMQLRQACGMDREEAPDTDVRFPLDDTLIHKLLELTMLLNVRPQDWTTLLAETGAHLTRHLSPPIVSGKLPARSATHLSELCLTGVRLHQRNRLLSQVELLIAENPRLSSIELAYTGVSNADVMCFIFPASSSRVKLTYLGLKGNRLNRQILNPLIELLNNKEQFRALKWVDLSNNEDIFTLPKSLLSALRLRYPPNSKPDFCEIANGRVVIMEDVMTLNV